MRTVYRSLERLYMYIQITVMRCEVNVSLLCRACVTPRRLGQQCASGGQPEGLLTRVEANADRQGAESVSGPLLPGMPNLHSHAFQRAMAGLAEVAGNPNDSFWTGVT